MAKIIILALVVTVVAIIAFSTVENATSSQGNPYDGNTLVLDSKSDLTVKIAGEVKSLGTYYMNEGNTLGDLIAKAGGATTNADPLAYDVSYTLKNGQSFYIAPLYDNSSTCSVTPIAKVNINSASADDLKNVPGFGTAIAAALVDHRASNGEFRRIEDIKDVSGIGEATFTRAKDHIRLRDS